MMLRERDEVITVATKRAKYAYTSHLLFLPVPITSLLAFRRRHGLRATLTRYPGQFYMVADTLSATSSILLPLHKSEPPMSRTFRTSCACRKASRLQCTSGVDYCVEPGSERNCRGYRGMSHTTSRPGICFPFEGHHSRLETEMFEIINSCAMLEGIPRDPVTEMTRAEYVKTEHAPAKSTVGEKLPQVASSKRV